MKQSIFFYKELTPAEVGKTGTHEVYIRLSNDFDYETFFSNSAIQNDSVLEVKFTATDITEGGSSLVDLRFVYYINNKNQEKRIPSLSNLFKKHNIQEGDIACLEKRECNSKEAYFIQFYKKGTITISPSSIYFIRTEDVPILFQSRNFRDYPLQQIFYGAPGTGKSHEVKKLTKGCSVIRTTFHPDSDYSTFVGAYKPSMEKTEVRVVPVVVNNGISLDQNNGTYKEKKIVYKYVKQAFLKAYLAAWKKMTEAKVVSANDITFTIGNDVYTIIDVDDNRITTTKTNTTNTNPDTSGLASKEEKRIIYKNDMPSLYNNINSEIRLDPITEKIRDVLKDNNPDSLDEAWEKLKNKVNEKRTLIEPQFLIIEEINRGNCAQIFGDLFQLLDRQQENGFSEYPIEADTDIQQAIETAFKEEDTYKLMSDINVEGAVKDYTSNHGATLSKDIQEGRIILLPPNFYIWATMNTSDQSLFPIDSAFKRRWDWHYMPICKGHDKNGGELNWSIVAENNRYDWWSFINKINDQIGEATNSEDKKLGFFFCQANNGQINAETFVNKVVFYLWNDVFKDYGFDGPAFRDADGTSLSFGKFFLTDTHGNTIVRKDKVELFLQNLGVDIAGILEEEPLDEDGNPTNVSAANSTSTKGYDYSKYSVNGNGSYSKGQAVVETIKAYVAQHPNDNAQTIVNTWLALGVKMPNMVETQSMFNARTQNSTDNRKRTNEIHLSNGEIVYVSSQFTLERINDFIAKVNSQNWGIKIEKI